MKINIEKVSELNRRLSVELPPEVVKNSYDRVFKSIQKDATIKGFRKGKVPMMTIKSMYGNSVTQDVVQDLIRQHYVKALDAHNLDPISQPEFEYEDPSEMSGFTFSASFEIRPEVVLQKYEGLEVEKEKYEFEESQIEKILKNIQNSRAAMVDVTDARPAKMGDVCMIDFDGYLNGVAFEGGKATDFQLELGSKNFIEGFEEGVVGMNLGETKNLNLKFPADYQAAQLAGKDVEFKVTLNSMKVKQLPELNDEFFATWGGPKSMVELTDSIKKDMEQSELKRIEDAFKNNLLKALVAANPVLVPQSIQREQKNALVENFKKRMKEEQGMSEQDFAQYVEKWDADFENTAKEMVQSSFLIDAIATKHELFYKNEDLDQKFSEYAKSTGIDEARIREFYNRPESLNRLTYTITEEKVVDFLTKAAKIKEVPKAKAKVKE